MIRSPIELFWTAKKSDVADVFIHALLNYADVSQSCVTAALEIGFTSDLSTFAGCENYLSTHSTFNAKIYRVKNDHVLLFASTAP